MTQRKRFDRKQPGARELTDSIVHGAAITEGTMVAFPTCFPAVTVPLPADESHITALDVTETGIVYAGTSGRASHLLVFMFHGITGMVFDMGIAEGAQACVALCCGRQKFVAAVNGLRGGRLVVRHLQALPFDLIQEWHIHRSPFEYIDLPGGERVLHALSDPQRESAVVLTDTHLFALDFQTQRLSLLAQVPGCARLVCASDGCIYGRDEGEALWRYSPQQQQLARLAVRLPQAGTWDSSLHWARGNCKHGLYLVDARGALFSFDREEGFRGPLTTFPLLPIGAMAVTHDGRLFASAGEGIARTFCYHPHSGVLSDLGVAVSVIERRRYGYCFGDAVVGRDGEIIFGENDELGHLWLYFPSIQGRHYAGGAT